MSTLAEVLAQHQLVSRGMSYGSPDRCSCGAETLPERGDEDVSVRRSRAFAEHQSAVVAEWLESDEVREAVEGSISESRDQFPRLPTDADSAVVAEEVITALAAHAKGEADE